MNIENILKQHESNTLDFKMDVYNLSSGKDQKFSFLKDVIAFSNTIRLEPSYIIFGVKELDGGQKDFVGITQSLDDANLQNIVTDRLFPIPKFLYHEEAYKDVTLGILEFPLVRYDYPITSKFKLKGIEKDQVYYRTGSRNTEADTPTTIKINDWMKTLPSETETNSFLSEALSLFGDSTKLLSEILPVLLSKSKKYGYSKLSKLIQAQLKDIDDDELKNHSYRYQEVYIDSGLIEFKYGIGVNDSNIKRELLKNQTPKVSFPIKDSIYKVENVLNDFKIKKILYMCAYYYLRDFKKNYKGPNATVFYFKDTFENLIINIKQRIIDEIASIK